MVNKLLLFNEDTRCLLEQTVQLLMSHLPAESSVYMALRRLDISLYELYLTKEHADVAELGRVLYEYGLFLEEFTLVAPVLEAEDARRMEKIESYMQQLMSLPISDDWADLLLGEQRIKESDEASAYKEEE